MGVDEDAARDGGAAVATDSDADDADDVQAAGQTLDSADAAAQERWARMR